MPRGKRYTKEFKNDAVRMSQTSGKSVAQVARDLGIDVNSLHIWRRAAISERRLPVPDNELPEQTIKRLETELKLVTEERDIIKKAIAYFAQPPKK
jgi:transposase